MLLDVSLDAVIDLVGTDRLSSADKCKVFAHYGANYDGVGYLVDAVGERALGALMREWSTLLAHVSDCRNPGFGHSVVVHAGDLYDPDAGLNPQWPWSRYVSRVVPIHWVVA